MLSRIASFNVMEKWWQHKPEDVLKNRNCKIIWDYTIYTVANFHMITLIVLLRMYKSSPNFIDITMYRQQAAPEICPKEKDILIYSF